MHSEKKKNFYLINSVNRIPISTNLDRTMTLIDSKPYFHKMSTKRLSKTMKQPKSM